MAKPPIIQFTVVVIRNKQDQVLDIIFPDMHNFSLFNKDSDAESLHELGLEKFCKKRVLSALLEARTKNLAIPFQATPAEEIAHKRILQVAKAIPFVPSSSRSVPTASYASLDPSLTYASLVPFTSQRIPIKVRYQRPVGKPEKAAYGLIWTMQLVSTIMMALATFLSVKLILTSPNPIIETGVPLLVLTPQIVMRLVMFVATNAAVAIRYPAKWAEDNWYGRKVHQHHTTASWWRVLPFALADAMGLCATIAQELFNFQSMRSLGNSLDTLDQRPSWLSNNVLFIAALLYAITDGITNVILNLNLTQGFAKRWADRSCPLRHQPVTRLTDLPSPQHRHHARTRSIAEIGAIADAIAAEAPCDSDSDTGTVVERDENARLIPSESRGTGTALSAQRNTNTAAADMRSPTRQRRAGAIPKDAHVIGMTSPKPSDSLLSPGSKMRAAQLTPS
jgi:hypothetical protein